jgi:hypothetical protein
VKVIICYVGSNGGNIGLSLRQYFYANFNGLTPFLAGRGSPDIPARALGHSRGKDLVELLSLWLILEKLKEPNVLTIGLLEAD